MENMTKEELIDKIIQLEKYIKNRDKVYNPYTKRFVARYSRRHKELIRDGKLPSDS